VLGAGVPVLGCAATGIAPPAHLAEVVWRAGLDLNPLDLTNPADVAWLEALIRPEHTHRRARLRAAGAGRRDAGGVPHLGDVPVMYHVPAPRREAFAGLVRGVPGHWIANEAPHVLRHHTLPGPPDDALYNVLALDRTPLAWTRSHGRAITLFG
jgi:hypothetical protein